MEEKKYLNEEQYQENAKKLKKAGKVVLIIGICMLVLGIILTICGYLGFGKAAEIGMSDIDGSQTVKGVFGGFGLMAIGGFLDTIGFGVAAFGGMIIFIAHRREITAFTTQQVMPIFKEGTEEITPTAAKAAGEIAKGIKKGLNEADKEEK